MVAYSFKARFAEPILAGTKDQTIRGPRKRHASSGEALQLYTGMRTRQCRLIGRTTCVEVLGVVLDFHFRRIFIARRVGGHDLLLGDAELDAFARRDGFADFGDMRRFWRETHDEDVVSGALIRWKPLTGEA